MAEKSLHISHFSLSDDDITRISIFALLVVSSVPFTIFSFHFSSSFIITQIFFILTTFAAGTWLKCGIIIAVICGDITLKCKLNVGIGFRQEVLHDT